MFKVSQSDNTLGGFLNLFTIHPFSERGIAFYRPVFREALHNIYFSIFGLNHLPFRIILFVIHFINIYLVYRLILNLFKRKFLSLFTAFFFGASAANVSTLYYLAGGIEASGATMFALLTLIFYKKFIATSKIKYQVLSIILALAAFSSHEIILSLPLILSGLVLISYPAKAFQRQLLKLWPFYLFLVIFLFIDLFLIGFSSNEEQYKFIINPKAILQSFIWYSAWAFGLPEMLLDFVLPGLKLNPALMRYWGEFYRVIFTASALSALLLLGFIFYLLKKKATLFLDKKFIFLISWFLIGISPVIFLPSHKSSHYLVFVLPAFWSIIGLISLNFYQNIPKKLPAVLVTSSLIISLVILSTTSIKLGEKTYWASTRGKLAEKLITDVKTIYPSLPKNSIIYFINDPSHPYLSKEWGNTSKQASLILNGSDALGLLYKDQTIKVYYEDFGKPPPGSEGKTYTLRAKLY